MKHRAVVLLMFVVVTSVALAGQRDQHEHAMAGQPGKLGTVHFDTSCSPAVRDQFDRGVASLHSFWFPEAIRTFEAVLAKDSSCAIAYWGIALSSWGNPFGGLRSAASIEKGGGAIQKAQSTGQPTPRERGYIDAAAELFRDAANRSQRDRTMAYEQAMERVSGSNPSDTEAQIFYALSIAQDALPTDKTFVNQLKAAAILEPLFKQQPDHPGLAHYIIHAYDTPPLAPKALDAARRYAKIAPAAPHALHMPSHTFTRVGYWQESIDANQASAEAARRADSPGETLHALDYQAYAYLQTAQDKQARRVVDETQQIMNAAREWGDYRAAGSFAMAAIPARYALERAAWADAAQLSPNPDGPPFTIAMTHFARAIGAARSGHPDAAKPDLDQLAALREKLTTMKDAYWAEQVDIERRTAEAWVAFAEGRKDEAVQTLRAAADLEDATDKAAVTPGPLAPARELLGYMLLDAGKAPDALVAFEATMKKEPNRFRGVYGRALAAETAGDKAKATQYYRQLLEIARNADTARPELQRARTFTGQKRTESSR
jgi:tetratricopeptide (TPR) repeat protein